MPRKAAHFIFYLSTLQKPAAGAGFCNVLKYKDDTFYLSTIQKLAPGTAVFVTPEKSTFFNMAVTEIQINTDSKLTWFL